MAEKLSQLGQVKLVQLQPSGLILETPGKTPNGYLYDPTRLSPVDQLEITPKGIEATIQGGSHVLDIHHLDHPDKEYDDDDLVCIGFTAHYDKMQEHFGEHMSYGIAGENIIIEYSEEVWPEHLTQRIGIENQNTGELAILEMESYASPCVEFSHFCIQNQYESVDPEEMKAVLKFLDNGRRGFLFVLDNKQSKVIVKPGDQVFTLAA